VREYSIRIIFQQLATATPYEILSLYADSDRSIHGLFSRNRVLAKCIPGGLHHEYALSKVVA
jgi:hypothetical protein